MKQKHINLKLRFIIRLLPFLVILLMAQNNPSKEVIKKEATTILQKADELKNNNQLKESAQLLNNFIQKAEPILGRKDSLNALLWHRLGIYYYYDKKYTQAISAYNNALNIRTAIFPKNHQDILKTKRNILVCYKYLYKTSEAYNIVEDIYKSDSKDSIPLTLLASLYIEIGDLAHNTGDYNTALAYFKMAEHSYTILKDTLSSLTAREHMIDYFFAMKKFEEGLAISKEIANAPKTPIFLKELIPNAHLNIAIALRGINAKSINAQLPHLREAMQLFAAQKDTLNMANIAVETAKSYLEVDQFDEAERLTQQSLLWRSRVATEKMPESWLVLGNVRQAKQQYKEALQAYQQATNLLSNSQDSLFFFVGTKRLDRKHEILEILNQKSFVFKKLYNKTKDIQYKNAEFTTYLTCDTLIGQIRRALIEDEAKYLLQGNAVGIYERAISLSLEQYAANKDQKFLNYALAFSAQNKSLVLLDALRDNRAKQYGDIPADKLKYDRDLRTELAYWEKRALKKDLDEADKNETQSNLLSTREKLEEHKKLLEKNYPKYFALRYRETPPLSITDIQQALPNDETALLEYFWGDTTLFTFAVSKSDFKYYKNNLIEGKDTLTAQLRAFRKSFANEDFVINNYANAKGDFLKYGYSLYQQLLQKPLAELQSPKTINRLRIVSDGALGYIPFDLFLYEAATEWKEVKVPYLLYKYSISYVWSNQLLLEDHTQKNIGKSEIFSFSNRSPFGGFGIEYDDNTLEALKNDTTIDPELRRSATRGNGALARLPRAADEVISAKKKIGGGNLWLNADASKAAFLKNAPNQGILHLAMHGYLDEKTPLNSSLIFSLDSTKDNRLTGYDIYAMQLRAGLSILSACNSGTGDLRRGEGVMSLARAFSYAGCPSVVVSLWSIPDSSTSVLMNHFYDNLKKGMEKDQALQQAKMKYLAEINPSYSVPNFWGASILVGDISPLNIETPSIFAQYWYLIVAALVVIMLIWLLRRKK